MENPKVKYLQKHLNLNIKPVRRKKEQKNILYIKINLNNC